MRGSRLLHAFVFLRADTECRGQSFTRLSKEEFLLLLSETRHIRGVSAGSYACSASGLLNASNTRSSLSSRGTRGEAVDYVAGFERRLYCGASRCQRSAFQTQLSASCGLQTQARPACHTTSGGAAHTAKFRYLGQQVRQLSCSRLTSARCRGYRIFSRVEAGERAAGFCVIESPSKSKVRRRTQQHGSV